VLPASRVVEYLGALAFQIAQTAEDRCEFRYVPGEMQPEQMNFTAMTSLLRTQWWSDLQIDYRPMDQLLGAGTRSKFPIFVREWSAETTNIKR
jgi:hypothetical protein